MADTDHIAAIDAYFRRSSEALSNAAANPLVRAAIQEISAVVAKAFSSGRKLMLAGNGGSAADAQHIAAEFLSRFTMDRKPLPAIALTTDTSVLTAVGNDYGFDRVFERQLRGLGMRGDVFMAISTSGQSPNILAALTAARELGITDSRNDRSKDLTDDSALRSVFDSAIGGDRPCAANSYRCCAHHVWTG